MSHKTSPLVQKWGEFIDESAPNISNRKKEFVAQIAENKSWLNESHVGTNIMSNGANMNGIGSITLPTNVQAGYTNFNQQTPGSGDIPVTMLSMAMSVAATTIAFDLLPTIPIYQPLVMLSYVDYIYGGGRLDSVDNPPMIVEVVAEELRANKTLKVGDKVEIYKTAGDATTGWSFQFAGFTRLEGYAVLKVDTFADKPTPALKDIELGFYKIAGGAETAIDVSKKPFIKLARAVESHYSMFSAYGQLDGEGVDRSVAERGTKSVLEMKTYTKAVRTKEHAVEGTLTRAQVRDIKAQGLDAYPALKVAMQNELSQSINKEILGRMRQLGVSSHLMLQKSQGLNLNTYIDVPSNTTKPIQNFLSAPMIDKNGVDVTAQFQPARNMETNSSAENLFSRQRRVSSRIVAGSALVGQASFWGQADACVVNNQLLAAIKESKSYQPSQLENDLIQNTSALYYAGTVNGVAIYCDPNMKWEDTTVILVRTGKNVQGLEINNLHEGLVFMPYDLASSVEIIGEGSMSPKCLIESVYAVAEVGIRPELAYLTFVCDATGFGGWV